MRTSELRVFVKRHGGGEEGLMRLCENLNERLNAQDQVLKECGSQMLQMAKVIDQLTTAGGMMRKQIEKMQGLQEDDEDLPDAHH